MSDAQGFLDRVAQERGWLQEALEHDQALPCRQFGTDRRSRVRRLTLRLFHSGLTQRDTLKAKALAEAARAGILPEVVSRLDMLLTAHRKLAACLDSLEQGFTHNPLAPAVSRHRDAFAAVAELLPSLETAHAVFSPVTTQEATHDVLAKRSTTPGDARALIVAGLNSWHGYSDGRCQKLKPIGVKAFARANNVSPGSVSAALKAEFGGHREYVGTCRRTPYAIASWLKKLNDEYQKAGEVSLSDSF